MRLTYDGEVKNVLKKQANNNKEYYEVLCADTVDKKENKITFFKESLFSRLENLVAGSTISVAFNYSYSPARKAFSLYADDFVEI